MFNIKLVITSLIIFTFLIITSTIKNKTRIIEKEISKLNTKIISNEKNINEAQLEFHYLTSPKEIERRLNIIGFENYQPIEFSKIFFDISHFINIGNKISNFKNLNGQKNTKIINILTKKVFTSRII